MFTKIFTLPNYRTPTILQMEAVECGAVALAIIMAYYGRWIALEELRTECDVSRDGSKAGNILKVARKHGFVAEGFRLEPDEITKHRLPAIVHWNFNHFIVLEKITPTKIYINDPGEGPKVITPKEFDESFTGIFLELTPTSNFVKTGSKTKVIPSLLKRLGHSKEGLYYIIIVTVLLIIPGLVTAGISKIFVDDVLIKNMTGWMKPLMLGLFLAGSFTALLTWLQQYYLGKLDRKLSITGGSQLFWHMLRLPIHFFSQRYPGSLIQRLQDNDRVAQLISGQLGTNLVNALSVVFYAIIMMLYNPLLTIIGISCSSANIFMSLWISRKRSDNSFKVAQANNKLLATGMAGIQMIETFKATGSESDFFARWSGYQSNFLIAEQQLSFIGELPMVFSTLINGLSTAIVIGVGALQVMHGYFTIGSLVAFQALLGSFNGPLATLLTLGGQLQEVGATIQRLDDVLRHPEGLRYKAELKSVQEKKDSITTKLAGKIEFRNVTFGYSHLSEPLIKDFNLIMQPGSRVALVGRSGSGKSTIAKLIANHYQPWSGEILLDDQPIQTISRITLALSVAIVDQEIFLYEGNIYDNLTLWDSTLLNSDVIQAAKDAYIHELIAERIGGYQGPVDENGRNFSGGQRQRLEIARALAGNPSILILDEATASLDPVVEKNIDDNIRSRGCSCLIVAHRLSTIRDSDEIIVLDNGVIAQRGKHEELISIEGPYKKMIMIES